ncbi:AraC family transcriptional regulator [Caproiciproducens sp. R2]|uniref:AraC family transcriptional regulator n=1 Tax=Caproiciproducens sp. R2 TaxID=3435187 RepID=UPI0040337B62
MQYLSSEFGELFIVYVFDDTYVVAAGPFLTEPVRDGMIVNMIQNEKIPIKWKQKLESYYHGINEITPQTYYYCGKLIASLFNARNMNRTPDSRPIGKEVGFIQEYFQNTHKNQEKMFSHPPFFLEKKIVNQIKIYDTDGALNTLMEINLLSRAVLAKDPLRSLKNSIICSCSFFTRAVIEAGVFPDIAFTYSDTFIQQIEKMTGISEVRNFEQEMLKEFIKLAKDKTSAKYSRPIFSALQYINNNLTQKLSLADIAKHAYVHPNYLSSIFKKEVGCSLTDFIARRRIEESTYFIAYTDYEIADIASFYHFCNQSYYCAVFKQHLFISPNEYRKSARPSC